MMKKLRILFFASTMVFVTTSYNNCGKLLGVDSEVKFSYLAANSVFEDESRDLESGATWLNGESFDEGMEQLNQMDDGAQDNSSDDTGAGNNGSNNNDNGSGSQANSESGGVDKFDENDPANVGITVPSPTNLALLDNGSLNAQEAMPRMRICVQANGDPGFQFIRDGGNAYSSCDICEVIDRINGRCLIRVRLPDPPPRSVAANGENSSFNDGGDGSGDPLIIDVMPGLKSASGKEISKLNLSAPADGIGFDIFGQRGKVPHQKFQISWTDNPRYMYLALPNSQGQILGVNELFGDNTFGPDKRYSLDGFEAISKYDGMDWTGTRRVNHADGVIDKNDEIYPRLRLWADTNFNGTAEANEVKTLEEMGLVSLDLKYDSNFYEKDIYGNEAIFKSVAQFENGGLGIVFDLWFSVDPNRPLKSSGASIRGPASVPTFGGP